MPSVLPRTVIAALLALLALGLGACGDSGSSEAGGATSETRTITDAKGEQVTLPAQPARVLPLSEPTLDATIALGIQPIATTAGRGQNAIPAYLQSRAKSIKSVGGLGAPNLEQVAQLAPDVILLDGTAFQDAAVIDKLRQIAPTVFVSKTGQDWRTAFEGTADALGRADQGADVLAAYDQRVNETKLAIAERADETVSIVRWAGIGLPAVLMKELCSGRVLTDLGLPRPAFQDDTGPGHTVPVSLEELEKIDGDWMFFGALGGGGVDAGGVDTPADVASAKAAIETAQETPGFDRLKAVKAGQVVPVDGSAWTSAGGPIAANLIVDDVARNLGS
jgi:iron complex transport system substrate-binding protein